MPRANQVRGSGRVPAGAIAAGLLLVLGFSWAIPAYAAAEATKPNVIVILIDDMGYSDVGIYGSKDIPTPHIDSLARHGTRFTNAYSSCPVCTPARAALLTGRYQERYGLEWVISPDRQTGKTPYGLDVREKTLADLLREQGYATGSLGKVAPWRPSRNTSPPRRGFDYFYGYLQWGHFYLKPRSPEDFEHPTDPWILFSKQFGGEEAAR